MKKLLFITTLFFSISNIYGQKCWHYQNQKNGKEMLSGSFTKIDKGTWMEKNNSSSFQFKEIRTDDNETILLDEKRNIYVKLTATEMWASAGNDKSWKKNYVGAWKYWNYDEQTRPDGEYAGTFTYEGGNKWVEKNNHDSFNYVEHSISQDEVVLFDQVRKVYVKLTPTEMFASWKKLDSWEKYYDGEWK